MKFKFNKSNFMLALGGLRRVLLDDTIWSVIGAIFGIVNGFIKYFGGCTDKATFWIVCALVCIMNLKETPRR